MEKDQEKWPIYQMIEERIHELIQQREGMRRDFMENFFVSLPTETESTFAAAIAALKETLPEIKELESRFPN